MTAVRVRVQQGNEDPRVIDGVLLIHTTRKRENNMANMDVIRQVSRYYGVDQSRVRIIRGRTSRNKVLEVDE